MIGTTLKHYRIVRILGHGGMGDVYAAEDLELRRLVALKTLPPETASDPDRLHRFRREAQAVAALNHPNIVTLYGVEEADGVHFLTMELVEGRTLGDLIPSGGMPVRQLLHIAVPLADAVRAAHERGVVHRDLKPANVMVNAEGRVKVLDFGLAKSVRSSDARSDSEAATATQLTAQFQVVGTAAYMSPEQAQGRAVDARSDVFSLGVVLYEMATGVRPFVGDSVVAVMSAIMRDTPPPPSEINGDVPVELDRAIRRCLAKEPDRRYQTATDLRNDLEDLQRQIDSGQGLSVRRTGSWRRRATRWLRPRWRFAAIAAVILVGAGAAAAVYWRPSWFRGASSAPSHFEFTQLTTRPGVEWFPSISPDGEWVVYAGEASGHRHIFMQSVGGQKSYDISGVDSAGDDDQPAFSPDGNRLAFRSTREGGGLFVMGRTGERIKKVSSRGFKPAWSPDGKRLAFTIENVELNPQNSLMLSELWTVDVESEEARVLYARDAAMPSWSPNDRRIAFTSRIGPPLQVDVWTIPASGGKPTPVTSDSATDWNPIWAPDGRYLYFSSDRDGSMNLWRVRIDESSGRTLGEPEPLRVPGSLAAHASLSADGRRLVYTAAQLTNNIQRLAFDPAAGAVRGEPSGVTSGSQRFSSPDPSPDGRWVVFYSLERPNGDLYLSRPDGTELHQLTSDPAIDRVPRWAPDGQWVACFSTRSGPGPSQLWKIRPDGSGLQQMTQEGASYFAWAPDGSRIAAYGGSLAANDGVWVFDPNRMWKAQKPEFLTRPLGDPGARFFVNSWSPDGTRLVGEVQGTVTGILMYRLATRVYERLADFGEWPVFLPDDRHVLFVAGQHAFYVLDTRTKQIRKVHSEPRDVIGPPRLTRDGTAMYFSQRHTEADIWLVALR
jgi:serine/threonine protein kinase/WD40 repeat protein